MAIKELKHYLDQKYFDKAVSHRIKIVGIIVLSIGLVSFWAPLGVNYKIGLLLLFIAAFTLFFISEKSTNMALDTYITLFLILWVLVMFLITAGAGVDIFFFSIVLGMIIIKELIDEFLTAHLKKRIILLNSIFFIVFMIFIAEKIISYVNI